MKGLLKLIGIVIGAVVVLMVVLILAVAFLVDPNDYKDEIAAAVEESTGRTLTIEGDLSLTYFPWIGIETGAVSLGNAAGFEGSMLELQRAEARLKLIPLIMGNLEVGMLIVEGLQVNLAVDEQGRDSWSDMGGDAADGSADTASGPDSLSIGGVEVLGARLVFDDRSAGVRHVVDPLNLELGALAPGQATDLVLEFVTVTGDPEMTVRGELETRIAVDLSAGRYRLDDLVSRFGASGGPVPGEEMETRLTLVTLEFDTEAGSMAIQGLAAEVAGLALEADIEGSQMMDAPTLNGRISVPRADLADTLSQLGMAYRAIDPSVMSSFSLDADFAASSNSLELSKLNATLDDTTLSGRFGIVDLSRSALRFNLKLDRIDLDRYLPRPDDAPSADAGQAVPLSEVEIPVATIRGLDLDGELAAGEIRFAGLTSTAVKLKLRASDGQLRMNPLQATLYEGSYTGDISVDARNRAAELRFSEKIEGVRVGRMLEAAVGTKRFTGRLDATAVGRASGVKMGDLTRSLDGNFSFGLTEGTLEGIDLWGRINQAYATYKGETPPPIAQPERTPISRLTASATANDGVFTNDDLVARLPFLNVTGAGVVDLPGSAVDYRVNAAILGDAAIEGEAAEALASTPVPLRISGSFDDLSVKPDISAALKAKAREKVDEKKEELLDKAKDKLKGLFGDG